METIYEKYMALPIDKGLLCLEYGDIAEPYFCYPVNAKPIGFEGCILYCFLPEYGEMVFAQVSTVGSRTSGISTGCDTGT